MNFGYDWPSGFWRKVDDNAAADERQMIGILCSKMYDHFIKG